MKTATLSLLATTAVFAGTSVYLALELGKARDALAAEVAARVPERPAPEREIHVPSALDEERSVEEALPPAAAGKPSPDTPQPANRAFSGRNEERPGGDLNSAAAQRQRRLMQETRLRRQFSDMPGELGLDRAQTDKLFDLLADAQVAAANNRSAYADDPIGARALAAAARQERDAQINALLGPDKAAEFLSFEKSIGARMQVGLLDAAMTSADIPLNDVQRKSLIAAIAAEQAAHPPPQRDPSADQDAYQSDYLAWQADYAKRVQEKVEPLLTAEQLTRYREAVELQNTRRAQRRARTEARRSSPPQP